MLDNFSIERPSVIPNKAEFDAKTDERLTLASRNILFYHHIISQSDMLNENAREAAYTARQYLLSGNNTEKISGCFLHCATGALPVVPS
jgi:hypothetical protein